MIVVNYKLRIHEKFCQNWEPDNNMLLNKHFEGKHHNKTFPVMMFSCFSFFPSENLWSCKKSFTINICFQYISTLTSITNRFYSFWLRILFLSLTFWRTLVCTKFNIKGLSWQGCLTDTKELNINNRCNYRENVHIMVLPVAETIEKQLMVVLRDRQQDLTDFLGPVLFIQILLSSGLITLPILLIQQCLFVH